MIKKSFLFIPLTIFTLLGFQNCGYFSTGVSSYSASSLCFNNLDLLPSFEKGHHKFFLENSCNNCHTPGGKGSGSFAQDNTSSAFSEFNLRGPERFRQKLSGGHQGYNFTDIEPQLKEAEDILTEGISKLNCSKDSGELKTSEKSLVFFEDQLTFGKKRILVETDGSGVTAPSSQFNKIQTIIFPLDDQTFSPSISGAELSIEVEIFYEEDFFYPTHYLVRAPSIKSPNKNLHIKGLTILLNNKTYLVTTYQGIDIEISPSDAFIALDPGGAAAVFLKDESDPDDIYDNTDTWSVQFESIEQL